ncbi:hypothetical protein C723_1293 [Christiangramia flava JLT2011]|nr:hypothetical protein C723_1293 [Christiangramia flava JLT2011]
MSLNLPLIIANIIRPIPKPSRRPIRKSYDSFAFNIRFNNWAIIKSIIPEMMNKKVFFRVISLIEVGLFFKRIVHN